MTRRHYTFRTVWLTALTGFLAGAFVVSSAVWRYGNVIGSRAAGEAWPPEPPPVMQRWFADAAPALVSGTTGDVARAESRPTVPVPRIGVDPIRDLHDRHLQLPLEGVTSEAIRNSFAEARGTHTHEAIDILAPRHTPVVAVEDGTIARLFYSDAGGITIYQFDPSEQYVYYYAHLDRYADNLHEGDTVRRGQVIGYVGTSGNAPKDTPHLHFAIFRLTADKRWWQGTPINPYEVLK